jgi:hypothetical protein
MRSWFHILTERQGIADWGISQFLFVQVNAAACHLSNSLFTSRHVVWCLLKTAFRLLTGLFNNLQTVTTINCYSVTGLHTLQTLLTNLFTLSSVVFTYLQYNTYSQTSLWLHDPLLIAHSLVTYCSVGFLYRSLLPRVTSVDPCYVTVGRAATSPRGGGGVLTDLLHHSWKCCHVTAVEGGGVDWPVTVAAAALVTSPLEGGGGALHSANTSHYVLLKMLLNNQSMIKYCHVLGVYNVTNNFMPFWI